MKKLLLLLIIPFLSFGQQNPPTAQDSLNINEFHTIVGPAAFMWDLSDYGTEVPSGSELSTIFCHEFFIGGLDDQGELKLAAQTYRQNGNDFWAGPVSNNKYQNSDYMEEWDRVWKINKQEIDSHINNYNNPDYQIPEAILNWPAHGSVALGQSYYLAPFIDLNENGIYNPQLGDYPNVKGDQSIYIIRNDAGNTHTESGGEQMGIEQHLMFYAYNCEDIQVLNHTIFVSSTIFNRGVNNLSDVYYGTYLDVDLGWYLDDLIGCNVNLNLGYGYNGQFIDWNGGVFGTGYGESPPAQGLVFLNKPMSKFVYWQNTFSDYGNPESANHYYNYLKGVYKNGQPMTFGDYGFGGNLNANYMFPANTDPAYPSLSWLDGDGNFNYNESDRRFLMSHGPFELSINDSLNLDYALIFSWDENFGEGPINSGDSLSAPSLEKLFSDTEFIQEFYLNNSNYECLQNSIISENSISLNNALITTIDILGRETKTNKGFQLHIYDDGSVEKKYIIK